MTTVLRPVQTGFMSARAVCEAIDFNSENPVDYCSYLARQGHITPVPGRRATYTRASVEKYIKRLCDAASVAGRSRGRKKS